MQKENDDTSVQVAVRIRPQLASEKIEMCRICTNVNPGEHQVVLGTDKAFTFDFVYDLDILQKQVYDSCAEELVDGTFEGLNATILAYGQTGSGKTYTMGTSFDLSIDNEQVGIIPRAVEQLFGGIAERKQKAIDNGETPPDFKVNAQFMEIYNEEIFDLLDTTRDPSEKMRKSHIKIHEDARGGIYVVGLTTRPVHSLQDTIQCLKTGTLSRTTASTNMNAQSSRSHAIFTLHVRQQRILKLEPLCESESKGDEGRSLLKQDIQELETLTAKFNFVDLAGSERLKRTGATGDRAKEGISINCGLLALGNVISALGDVEKRGCHVPYRDSKLTRLLQDSLGGNSRTTMIACISPSDRDFMETLNTLKYANRARNIRNKVVVNQDLASSQMAALRAEIQSLHRELNDFRMGRRVADGECASDLFLENQTLQSENEALRHRVKALQLTVDSVTSRNAQLESEKQLHGLMNGADSCTDEEVKNALNGYIGQIEQLRSKLSESDALVESMKKSAQQKASSGRMSRAFNSSISGVMSTSLDFNEDPDDRIQQILDEAKKDLMNSIKSIQSEKSEDEAQTETDKETAEGAKTGTTDKEGGTDEDESESESENECGRLEENLADLTCEISIKQKLIDELEMSQKRLRSMKMQYEEKLTALETRIRQTEQERDRMLSTIGGTDSQKEGKAKKVREEYDLKLNAMQGELKKLHAAKREHAKLMKNQTHYETQLQTLQRDLAELKRMKVKLMRQLQEEAQKTRQTELRRQKEVAQLKKQERIKDNKIKSLETEKKKKETILRRKLEEVEALRKRQKQTMSQKAAGRVGKHSWSSAEASRSQAGDIVDSVDPRLLKTSWDSLEKMIASIINKRQTLAHLDKDMERWIKQREVVGKKLEKFLKRQEKAMSASAEANELANSDLNDQIECLRDNLSFIQENINECQNCVVRLEEMRVDDVDPTSILASCSFIEAVYLLEHCTSLAINKGLLAAQKDDECRELVAKLHQEQMESIFQRDMLQYLIQDKVDVEIDNGIIWQDNDVESDDDSVDSLSPTDSLEVPFTVQDGATAALGAEELCLPVPSHLPNSLSDISLDSLATAAAVPVPNKKLDVKSPDQDIHPTKDKADTGSSGTEAHSGKSIRPTGLSVTPERLAKRLPSSPSPARRPGSAVKTAPAAASKKESKPSSIMSPPGPLKRNSSIGVINAAVAGKATKDFLLVHSHTAVGHLKAVLSVCASDSTLYSSSKDRTAKLWDLSTGVEVLTLDGHPNNVVSVKFSEATSLIFTASAYLIKVWDARSGKNCLSTLTSAGMVMDSCPVLDDGSSRPISCPPGEINITDIALSSTGTLLYTAAGNTVRIWDLKMMRSVGKLFGGNQASVMSMAISEVGPSGSSCVVTGSKDRCIKIFQVGREFSGVLNPRCSLESTHSDSIESLCISATGTLFSGSRDMCIKTWDLAEGKLKQSISTAHRDWICGLTVLPRCSSPGGVLLSACRAGVLRTWSLANCTFLGETQAHVGPINSICTNSSVVFTASTDRSIRLWRQKQD